VKLILKGGGCENMNAQYSLPAELPNLGRADRSLEGVRKCILHAVWHAQGKGCAPGAIGVCIGGDRTSGYVHAKEQLFRTLDDVNPDPRLAELEASIMGEVNKLGVGAMGFGGRVSLIGCKVGAMNRLPASFFVSVAYDCWAYRRLGVVLDGKTGAITKWLYRMPRRRSCTWPTSQGFVRTGREITLRSPLTEDQVRSLKSVTWCCSPAGRIQGATRAPSPHETRSARRSSRRCDLSLWSGGGQRRKRMARHCRGTDDEHFEKSRIRQT
jgi:fumarate hydratase class I